MSQLPEPFYLVAVNPATDEKPLSRLFTRIGKKCAIRHLQPLSPCLASDRKGRGFLNMKIGSFTKLCLLGSAGVALFAQDFTRIRHSGNWDPRAADGNCEVRVWVDNAAEVGIRGERVFVRTLQGQPARDVGTTCNAPLPRSGFANMRVRSIGNRGDAQLIEQPNEENGYTAVIRVEDHQAGGAEYVFRIDWRSESPVYFTDRDYDRPWNRSRWERRLEGEGTAPPDRVQRSYRSERTVRRTLEASADGWGRVHADQREGQRITRMSVRTEGNDDAFVTFETDRGPMRFVGRVTSQDDRSLGISLREANGRPADGYFAVHFDPGGNIQTGSLEGNWGSQHFVASFNRRYGRN